VPGAELADRRRRSGVGWLTRRWDIAALALLFVFGGMLNAFAMVAPAYRAEEWLARVTGVASEAPLLAVLFVVLLVLVPLSIVVAAAGATTVLVRQPGTSVVRTALSYAYTLVPFGFGVWTAHYGFHFLTGVLTIVPVVQSAAIDIFGWAAFGQPLWRWTGMRPGLVFPIQLGLVMLGAVGSLALAYRVSGQEYPNRPGLATLPWAIVTIALGTGAAWVLSQPMEMRGVGFPG
jgi:hypothetical protein